MAELLRATGQSCAYAGRLPEPDFYVCSRFSVRNRRYFHFGFFLLRHTDVSRAVGTRRGRPVGSGDVCAYVDV